MAIAVDASVARWTGTPSGTTAITSASFTPANNSLIVLCVNADEGVSTPVALAVSGGGLTWTERVRRGDTESGDGLASIWTAPVTTGASMTIAVNRSSGDGGTSRLSAKAYLVTGQHASPIGNSNSADWTTNPQTLNVTAAGAGRMFGCGTDWNQTGVPVSTDTEDGADYSGAISVMSAFKAADHVSGTQGIQFDPVGSPSGNVVVLEILAAAGGAITGTATWTWIPSATLRGSGALSGSASWIWSPTGNLTDSTPLSGAMSGSTTWTWAASASLAGSGTLSGSAAWTWTPSATLGGAGALSGATSWVWSPTGTLRGAGALSGTASWQWGQAGSLTGSGALAGSSTWVWTPSGTLIDLTPTGEISGSASWTWTASATLTNASAPVVTDPYPKPAGRPSKRKRYEVEIDGQVFEVESPAHAQALLDKAHELALKKAPQVAEAVVAERIKLRTPDRKPIRVPTPQLHTSSDELASIVIKARHDIARVYRQAAMDAEIRLRLQSIAQADDDDDVETLLLL